MAISDTTSVQNDDLDVRPTPAVGVVCFRGDEVLLVRRGTPPLKGAWSLPGGRIEPGETTQEAALRELGEETGVSAQLIGLVDVVDAIFTSRRSGALTRHYVLVDYAARWQSGEPIGGDDAADAKFFSSKALQALDLWDETVRVIEKARGMVDASF